MSTTAVWPDIPVPLVVRAHSFNPRDERTRMESARTRKRRLFTDALELVDVTWHFTYDQFETFKGFFEDDLEHGSNRFEMSHYSLEESVPGVVTEEYTFWENYTWSRSDNLFAVTATLEVAPPEPDDPLPEPDLCELSFDSSSLGEAGDSFDCYLTEDPVTTSLNSGNGWDAAWHGAYNFLGVQALEPFTKYSVQDPVSVSLNKGFGWTDAAHIERNFLGLSAYEDFESYTEGIITGADMTGGDLWDGFADIEENA